MEQLKGQISIFDYLNELAAIPQKEKTDDEPVYKRVYLVTLGDIVPAEVFKSMEHRYYCFGDDNSFAIFGEDDIGFNVFTSEQEAKDRAKSNLGGIDCLSSEMLRKMTVKVKGYKYIRSEDKKELYGFYAVLENGYIYLKLPPYYDHIAACTEDEADRLLQTLVSNYEHESDNRMEFKNMYRCKQDIQKEMWLYTEAVFCEKLHKESIL
jgi:hypothetical protein